jgi:hypothetical protein
LPAGDPADLSMNPVKPLTWWWRLWKRRNLPEAQRNMENAVDAALTIGGVDVNLKTVVSGVQWVNVITLLAQLLNVLTNAFPQYQSSPWVLVIQGIIGAVLPSVGGIGHQLVFKTPQDAGK